MPRRILFPFISLLALCVSIGAAGLSAPHAAPVAPPSEPGLLCQSYSGKPDGGDRHAGMAWVPGGETTIGSDEHYSEEGPATKVRVDGFWMDRTEVTNAQFARFVEATGYVTEAERVVRLAGAGSPRPAGSVVFVSPLDQMGGTNSWWRLMPGANWRHPEGPGSDIEGRRNHPVVHVTHQDALAYARWLGRELPTEAQWEFAARGGLEGAPYAWGGEFTPQGLAMANTWQGFFPIRNTQADGYRATAPVGCFKANGYGLYDMIGNVWEWTSDWYRPRHDGLDSPNPTGPRQEDSYDPRQPDIPSRVIKGGSFLCAQNFCQRYRPASRHPQEVALGASHLGFRTVLMP
ncbi:SUMF1/EgtB/PvdO family nonheme iron enzyme [Azospirillum melinis]|uniref:SUMF1/EgtB/PvdO family nonheme iron enzyme n=1 Tax=Azospirillum melinis TaxID=328839 RepID=A0ABX2KFW6_9PROT|nr:formylglycine-generating enzyme family protein [Azospirillum melinis]MBP2310266.1 formylglycine-generating enzyme required for sulfatase activity [Azospirillum melinis]NUB02044.1 SUMF1/EgtB/PvdO family nonheme iron enzyme [Azospirillum melinis]